MENPVFVRFASAAVAIAVVLAGLVVYSPTATAQAPPASVLRIGSTQEPDSVNPFVAVLSASYFVFDHVYDLLVGIGPDLTPVPQLARSWSVAPNGTAWTFNLQQNVKWHDGQPFTSADVKFTYQYIQRCKLFAYLPYVGDPTDPGPDGAFGTADDPVVISQMATPNPDTIIIYTNKPKVNMLSLAVFIVPEHIWSAVGCRQAQRGYKNEPPIGTGIYKFVQWSKGQFLRLAYNPDYFLKNPNPNFDYVDEIVIRYYLSTDAVYNDFVAGNLDATGALTAQQWLSLKLDIDGGSTNPDADPTPDITKFKVDSISMSEVGACVASDATIAEYAVTGNRHWLVTNRTLRAAIQTATNRYEIVRVVQGGVDAALGRENTLAKPGDSLIPPATPFWHYNVTAAENYTFDLQKAALMLSDPAGDGWKTTDGNPPNMLGSNLDFVDPINKDAFADVDGDGIREVVNMGYVSAQNPQATPKGNPGLGTAPEELNFGVWIIDYALEDQDTFNLYKSWWSQIGVKVTAQIVSEGQQIAVSYACDYDFYDWGWGFDVDPNFGLSVLTKDQILGWQDAWYVNAQYDQWYLDQQAKVDLYQRQKIVHDMQRVVYRDAPYLITYYPFDTTVVRSDRFTGWGDWEAHPGLGLIGYYNAFLMLTLTPLVGAANQCPTQVEIGALTQPVTVFNNRPASFVGTALDAESDALNWTFDWKDGSTTQVDTPGGDTSVTVTHTWTTTGNYNITLTVTDKVCGSSPTSPPVWVRVIQAPAIIGWIAGSVTDTGTTQPLAGVLVSVQPGGLTDVSDAVGQYNVTVAAPATYQVTASKALYAPQTKSAAVTANATATVDFALVAQIGWIAGKVTDATTGAALVGVALRAVNATGRQYPTTADANGRYNVSVSPGTYTVEIVEAQGYVTQSKSNVIVANGQTATVDFALQPVPRQAGLSALQIAAIVVLAAIVIGGVGLFAWRRRKREAGPPPPAPPPPPPTQP